MNEIRVLDHGFARIVSYTQPADRNQRPGWTGDTEIVRNARVSYNAEWRTGEDDGKDKRLIHFLRLRLHEHAQYEIRVYAIALLGLIEEIVPVAAPAFKNSLRK